MKRKIIISILITLILGISLFLCFYNSSYILKNKEEIIQNISIENENVLKSGSNITIEGNVKNNNDIPVKIKNIKVTVTEEETNKTTEIIIKINDQIKPSKTKGFSKTIKVNATQRIFTKYDIEI